MIEPHSIAGDFFFRKINGKAKTLEAAFDLLYEFDRNPTSIEAAVREWKNLKITQFKKPSNSWAAAMECLYERAIALQNQLDDIHQHPQLLIEILEQAVRDEPFYLFMERSSVAKNPHAYFHQALHAISKQELQNEREEKAKRKISDFSHTSLPSDVSPPKLSGSNQLTTTSVRDKLFKNFFARAGRRYGVDNRTVKYAKKNPIGRDGTRLLCRECNSDTHLIKECPRAKKPSLIAFAMDLCADAYDLPPNDLFDIIQDLPDSVWYSLPSEIRISKNVEELATDTADAVENDSIDKPSQIMYSRLASWSEEHLFDRKPVQIFNIRSNHSMISTSQFLDLSKIDVDDILKTPFSGVMIDNGASKTPSGLPSYLRYCAHTGHKPTIKSSSRCFAGIGNGIIPSLALADVRMPLTPDLFLEFEVNLIDQDVPLMFGLDKHLRYKCSTNEYNMTFTHHPSGVTIPLHLKKGHLYIEWPNTEVLFTRSELKQMHKNFSHPSNNALINVLKRARPSDVNSETKKMLEDIVARCKQCQTFRSKPTIFRVSLPMDEIVFNHEIEVDIMWIDGDAIIHIIDRGTRYSVAKYLNPQTAENAWNLIIEFWVSVFNGFPQIIAHDQGPQFTAEYFQDSCAQLGIITKETPTESHNSLST